jgi:hypothetical protein
MPLKLPASSKMRLGISSWTYPWSIGMDGFPSSRHPIRLADLLTRASLLQVQVVQVADNLPLHLLDEGELRDACAQAAELGLTIEVGTRGVDPARLRQYLKIALSLKARMLRTLLDPPSSQLSLKQAEASLRKVGSRELRGALLQRSRGAGAQSRESSPRRLPGHREFARRVGAAKVRCRNPRAFDREPAYQGFCD